LKEAVELYLENAKELGMLDEIEETFGARREKFYTHNILLDATFYI